MIYLNLVSSILFSILTTSSITNPAYTEENNPEWNFVEERGEIIIYERWVHISEDHKTRERKGEFSVKSPVSEVLYTIRNSNELLSWMPSAISINVIECSENMWVSHILFDAPWPFKQRDLIAEYSIYRDSVDSHVLITVEAKPELLSKQEEVVRIESLIASWEIYETESDLEVVYSALSDTPPVVPRWIQDPITQKMFWESLNNFRDQVHKNVLLANESQVQ